MVTIKTIEPKTEADYAAANADTVGSWVAHIMPNAGRPVTHWLVAGPFRNTGQASDIQYAVDFLFEGLDAALSYATDTAEAWGVDLTIVICPPDDIAGA